MNCVLLIFHYLKFFRFHWTQTHTNAWKYTHLLWFRTSVFVCGFSSRSSNGYVGSEKPRTFPPNSFTVFFSSIFSFSNFFPFISVTAADYRPKFPITAYSTLFQRARRPLTKIYSFRRDKISVTSVLHKRHDDTSFQAKHCFSVRIQLLLRRVHTASSNKQKHYS